MSGWSSWSSRFEIAFHRRPSSAGCLLVARAQEGLDELRWRTSRAVMTGLKSSTAPRRKRTGPVTTPRDRWLDDMAGGGGADARQSNPSETGSRRASRSKPRISETAALALSQALGQVRSRATLPRFEALAKRWDRLPKSSRRPVDEDLRAFVNASGRWLRAWSTLRVDGALQQLGTIARCDELPALLDRVAVPLERLVRAQRAWRSPGPGRPVNASRFGFLMAIARILQSAGIPVTKTRRGAFERVASIVCAAVQVPLPAEPHRVLARVVDEHRAVLAQEPPQGSENVFRVGAENRRRDAAK
jgi:hypothetical protein